MSSHSHSPEPGEMIISPSADTVPAVTLVGIWGIVSTAAALLDLLDSLPVKYMAFCLIAYSI